MHSNIHGLIRYTSKKPERMDEERGLEYFSITPPMMSGVPRM